MPARILKIAMAFEGMFDLRSPQDLLEKLRRDHARLQGNPLDRFAAFDFFVTAWHMLEWLYPRDPAKRMALRDQNPLLQVCEHLANGGKHFVATSPKHQSVAGTEYHAGDFTREFSREDFNVSRLLVRLQGAAAAQLGSEVWVEDLADEVLKFWEAYIPPRPSGGQT